MGRSFVESITELLYFDRARNFKPVGGIGGINQCNLFGNLPQGPDVSAQDAVQKQCANQQEKHGQDEKRTEMIFKEAQKKVMRFG